MPMNRALYPSNWDEIALQIKQDVNWTCEHCDRPCRRPGESVEGFFAYPPEKVYFKFRERSLAVSQSRLIASLSLSYQRFHRVCADLRIFIV